MALSILTSGLWSWATTQARRSWLGWQLACGLVLGAAQLGAAQPASADSPCCAHGGPCETATPTNLTASVSIGRYCFACVKIREEYYARQKEQQKAAARQYDEELAQKRAAAAAKAAAQVERENVALAQLAAAESSLASFDQLRQQQRARRAEIERKFEQQEQARNNDYLAYLAKIQAAPRAEAAGTGDDFWNETVAVAAYEPVQDPKTRRWGFQTKQGKLVLDYAYDNASAFSKGAAFVQQQGVWKIIDTHNQVQRTLTPDYFKELSADFPGLTGINKVASFSDGLAVVEFTTNPRKNNASWGVLDAKGRVVVGPDFSQIEPFKNGTAQASKFITKDDYTFENDYPGRFLARFAFLEVGLITTKGSWVQAPRKKLVYFSDHFVPPSLTIISASEQERYTRAELETMTKTAELKTAKANAESMKQLEAEVDRRVSAAKSQGMLVEKIAPTLWYYGF